MLKVAMSEAVEACLEGEAADEADLLLRIGWPIAVPVLRAIGKRLRRALCARRRWAVPVGQGPVSPGGRGVVREGADGEAADRQHE
ncbi:hypothetical protein [Kitasatospora xanthocidica]|uniref:hypothetical protein n=1 Tax=Kitasatospora xanthocidica TaxID=83382 RepID=UPI0011C413B0|nr:hypothetical protein [Kitasatospora xanthocidica]